MEINNNYTQCDSLKVPQSNQKMSFQTLSLSLFFFQKLIWEFLPSFNDSFRYQTHCMYFKCANYFINVRITSAKKLKSLKIVYI